MIDEEEEKCPNCKIDLEWTNATGALAGDIYIDTAVTYCPKCLYLHRSEIDLSHC